MVRTILKSDQKNLTIQLPDDLVGKLIEVIAFEINEESNDGSLVSNNLKPSQMRGFLSEKSSKLMQEHVKQSRQEWDI